MKQPDLNLLIYLDLLIKHGSVTRDAQEMGVSQPGVSAALRRLRAVLQDPVLVRTGGGMVPTAKARAVQAQVAGALGLWARLADGDMVFDPARTTRSYSLLASDYIQFLLLPGLARELARQAPQATLRVIPPNPYRRLQMLVEREADFAIGYYHQAPEELRTRRLFIEPVMCVMRRGHPDAACFDLDAFVRSSHVGDHVATLPASLATAFARQLPLQVVPSPIALPALDVSILYHDSQQDDAAHQWFRQLVVEVVSASGLARTVDQEPPMPAPH